MKRILAGIDFSDVTDEVVGTAARLASAFGASLDLLHVRPPEPAFVGYAAFAYPGEDARGEELAEEKRALKERVHRLREGGLEAKAYLVEGDVVRGILDFARESGADAIVVGRHGHDFVERMLLGSVATGIVRGAEVPVTVVPAGALASLRDSQVTGDQ